jgi:DNA-binding transcriptional MerR regulator
MRRANHTPSPPSPRPADAPADAHARSDQTPGDARAAEDQAPAPALRIGDVARLAGTTPRTIRYYEELSLLPEATTRPAGQHRLYSDSEVERLREVMRLKQLLGVSLEELKTLLTAEEARAAVRAELRRDDVDRARRRELLNESLGHLTRQLELVEHRMSELTKLREELAQTRTRVRGKLRELDALEVPAHA